MTSILKVEQLGFTYDKETFVFRDINMEFDTGSIYGICGKSGAGKTTLLCLLAGLEKTHYGQIFYQEQPLSSMNLDHYRRNHIGVVFQSYNLLPHLTALENVILSMDISDKKVKDRKEEAYRLLTKVGINQEKANRKILHLSGGEQQRVSIARALSYQSSILLADEPTGNLDHETEEDIINLLVRLAHDEQKCVIVVSHSSYVKEQMDHVYHLENGTCKKIY